MNQLCLLSACALLFITFALPGVAEPVPKIILKLDDVKSTADGKLTDGWEQAIAFLDEQGIKASLGIICNSLEKAKPPYFARLKELDASGRYEFWHHGWDHSMDNATKTSEFKGRGYEAQRESFAKAQEMMLAKTGITMHGFGAPYNATDDDTVRVIAEFPAITYWMYASPKTKAPQGVTLLPRISAADLEKPVHVPNPESFMAGFEANRSAPVLTLQGHPPSWTKDTRFADFKTIVLFLKEQGCEFVLPSEYVASVRSGQ